MTVEQLQKQIEALSAEEFAQLRRWIAEKDWETWDRQLEDHTATDKLDFLLDEATDAKKRVSYPNTFVSARELDIVTGIVAAGGDALADSEALHDPDRD